MHITTIEPEWISEQEAIAIHERQLAEHGGGTGIRDIGLLQSALARPQNAHHYNQVVSLSKLAACYGFGIAKNHAFVDGNKRTAYVVMRTFLLINGLTLDATKEDKYLTMYAVAAGDLTEEQLAIWLESKLQKL
ncbi:MAG: type II toxin-antitoxin system death-on-curing family toxin [Pseudomonadota bacterium]|nr:type II toxin-antitoxin system death-on-curing family toxin [Pseudomonadota bacterium]